MATRGFATRHLFCTAFCSIDKDRHVRMAFKPKPGRVSVYAANGDSVYPL